MSRNDIFEKVGRILTGCIKATENFTQKLEMHQK